MLPSITWHHMLLLHRVTQIQFTYWIDIPYAALSIRFIPLTSQNKRKKEGIEIFHQFYKSSERARWIKTSRPLPLNQSSSYFLRFEVNGGIGRGSGNRIRVTNITLSKECFGIGKIFVHSLQSCVVLMSSCLSCLLVLTPLISIQAFLLYLIISFLLCCPLCSLDDASFIYFRTTTTILHYRRLQ